MRAQPSLLRAWLPAIVWLGIIALESTSGLSSDHTARFLQPLVRFFAGDWGLAHLETINHLLRKIGHFVGYAMLSWLAFRGWLETLRGQRRHRRNWSLRAAVMAVLTAVVVAVLDEFHQSFLPSRTGVFRDVVLDTFGGIFAQCMVLVARFTTARR